MTRAESLLPPVTSEQPAANDEPAGSAPIQSLRDAVTDTVRHYLKELDGEITADVYQMVLAEIEAPLLTEIGQTRLAAYQKDRFWALTAFGELFYTIAGQEGQQQEQTRAGLGIERTFKHGRRLRFEVTWQQQGFFYDADKAADVIYFRLGFLKSW